MAIITAKEYIEGLGKLRIDLYLFGEKVENWVEHPVIRPSINAVVMSHKVAHEPKNEALATTESMHGWAPLKGRRL